MVFSFFKKSQDSSDNKMPERQVARPKAPAAPAAPAPVPVPALDKESAAKKDLPDLDFAPLGKPALTSTPSASKAVPPMAPPPVPELEPFSDSEFERDFTASSVMAIDVDDQGDPVQADIEQAAVLFANGQDQAARAVLETCARAYSGAEALRFWHMLMDLLQVMGDRAAFDALGEEFVKTLEISPPAWRTEEPVAKAALDGPPALALQGVIAGSTEPQIAAVMTALAKKQPIRLDLGKLVSCDDDAAKALVGIFRLARKQAVPLSLEQDDTYVARLSGKLVMGQRENENSWLLLLELLQRQNRAELFEEKAVDYAVTFEVSPPSWEAVASVPAKPLPKTLAPEDPAFVLSGEIRNSRFEDLEAFFLLHDHPIIDFSRVKRIDFTSAGLLRNVLANAKKAGKDITIRNPNHLMAELMGVVGVQSVARIIVPKS